MSRVIYEPQPRFVVEVGTVEEVTFDGSGIISWEFHSAWGTDFIAKQTADSVARKQRLVRVVDREAEGA